MKKLSHVFNNASRKMKYVLVTTPIANAMPSDTGNGLAGLKDEAHINNELQAIQRALDNSWSSWHYDHYHTQVYTTESCSTSNGSTRCSTEVHTRQVYDYTENRFTYY